MGVYIYSLRSPKLARKIKLEDGTVANAAVYAFEYKPYNSLWHPEPRWQRLAKARITRSGNIWKEYVNNGNSWPDVGVVVHSDKKEVEVGCQVYSWNYGDKSLPVCFEDVTMNNGKFMGKVAEVLS